MTFSWQQYYANNMRAISQGLNALTGGDEDEMICGRVGKRAARGGKIAKVLELILDRIFGKGHCARCIEPDEGGSAVLR
jgi:hypothetical protein